MIVFVPLADNENCRISSKNRIIKIHTSECSYPFNHIFFSEIGKLLYFFKTNHESFESICVLQNRRFFKDFDNFPKINDNTVYLAKKENIGPSIIKQFYKCHNDAINIFDNMLNNIKTNNINKKILEEKSLSPHNIFYANKLFFDQYCNFLNENLIQCFNEKYDKKIGAFIAERLLHLFACSNFNVIEKEITTLPKE